MNNAELATRDAHVVKSSIERYLDTISPKQSEDVIDAAFANAIDSLNQYRKQHPNQLKLLRDIVITMPFSDATIFNQVHVDKLENKPYNPYIPTASDTLTPLRKNIVAINATDSFKEGLEKRLLQLEKTSIGRRLIEKMSKFPHTVYIMKGDSDTTFAHDIGKSLVKGVGTSSTVTLTRIFNTYLGSDFKEHFMPYSVVLAHELIHAYHNMQGKSHPDLNIDRYIWEDSEEWYTINGLPSTNPLRATPKISEKALLQELELPTRVSYYALSGLNPVQYTRLKHSVEQYRRVSRTFTPNQNICPPIIRLTHEELEPSTFVVRIFLADRYHLYSKSTECDETFVWRHIPITELTPEIYGPHTKDLHWVSDYRLSLIEVAAIQRLLT